jgi:hypothetical protein
MRDLARRCVPSLRYVAPHTAKIHTPITLGIRHRVKPFVFKLRKRRPCGFDFHRPLQLSIHEVPGTISRYRPDNPKAVDSWVNDNNPDEQLQFGKGHENATAGSRD